MVRRDLADSSDEEEEKNPLEMKYNSFGKDVKRIARISSEQSRSMKSGFNDIEGNTINLSNEASNKKLCKDQVRRRNISALEKGISITNAYFPAADRLQILPAEDSSTSRRLRCPRGAHARKDFCAPALRETEDAKSRRLDNYRCHIS